MEIFLFVVGIIFIITDIAICIIFSQIAESKGWEKRKYFWLCLFGGIMGALLIIALPDKDRYKFDSIASSNSKKMLDEVIEIKAQIAQIADRSNS